MLASMPKPGPDTPQRQGILLAVVIDLHAVAAVKRPLGYRVKKVESRHHGAGRQHLDLEIAAGRVIDLLGVVKSVLVENVPGRPGALPSHGNRPLGFDDRWKPRRGRNAGYSRYGCIFQKLSPADILVFLFLDDRFHLFFFHRHIPFLKS